jgi:hypothetical protein
MVNRGRFEEIVKKDSQKELSILSLDSWPRLSTHIDKLRHGNYKQIIISA